MIEELEDYSLDQLLAEVRSRFQEEHPHTVSVSVVFNGHGYEISRQLRTPGSLERDGISMRNMKGDFIQ